MAEDRMREFLEAAKGKAKESGISLKGYSLHVARSAADNSVLAFVFYPPKPERDAVLIPVGEGSPYEGSCYAVNSMLWKMGAKGRSFQED